MASYRATWESGSSVTWRDLTWEEFDNVCGGVDPHLIPPEVAHEVYKACIIEAPDIRLVTAGIVHFVAKHQVQNNPFSGEVYNIINALDTARATVNNNYLLSAQAMVANVFDYKLEEIRTWTANKFFLRVAQAEVIVGPQLNPAVPEQKKDNLKPRVSARELAKQRYLEGQKK